MNQGVINLGNPVSSSPLNRGLVGWWLALPQRMGGNRLLDLCQPGNHGTLTNGPTWQSAAGRLGGWGSVLYDGTNDYASIGYPTGYVSNGHASFSAWFTLTTLPSAFICTLNDYNSGAGSTSWFHGLNSSNKFIFLFAAGSVALTSAVTLAANTWYHVAAVRGGSAGAWTRAMYINGVLDVSDTHATNPPASQPGSFSIGRAGDFNGDYWPGRIDDVRLANRAWSSDEVWQLYNDSRTGYGLTLNRLPRRSYAVAGGGGGNRRRRVFC